MTPTNKQTSKYFPASPDFEVTAFPMYWVARLHAAYGMEMEKKLKPLGLDVSRWRVAMQLRVHGELSISQIAEHAVAKLPTITKIVYRMQDEGLVAVKTSESDGRVSVVDLTAKGNQAIDDVIDSTQKLFRRLFNGLSEAQITRLNGTLEKMLDNLQED